VRKLIIWLFEKYCLDYWIMDQVDKEKQEVMRKNNITDEQELEEYYQGLIDEPLREAYCSGKADGYNKAVRDIKHLI